MSTAVLHNGTVINFTTHGQGPALLLSAGHRAPSAAEASEAWSHGVDPQPGVTIARLLRGHAHTVLFDYEAHVFQHPMHRSLTLDNIAQDLLAIADAANVASFAFYGSSWLAMLGPHLEHISDRLTGFAMCGFPPIDVPLHALLDVARHNHAAVIARASQDPHETGAQTVVGSPVTDTTSTQRPELRAAPGNTPVMDLRISRQIPASPDRTQFGATADLQDGKVSKGRSSRVEPGPVDGSAAESSVESVGRQAGGLVFEASKARQFVTFFADACRQPYLTQAPTVRPVFTAVGPQDLPRVCFVAEHDVITDNQGRELVSIARPVIEHRQELQELGWTVEVLDTDSLGAAQPDVAVRILTPWLATIRTRQQEPPAAPHREKHPATGETLTRPTSNNEPLYGTNRGATDPIDAYLESCGVPGTLFTDERLREVTGALLAFLGEDNADERPADSQATHSAGVGLSALSHRSGGASAPGCADLRSKWMREMLDVQIIKRLNELRYGQPRSPGTQKADISDRDLEAVDGA